MKTSTWKENPGNCSGFIRGPGSIHARAMVNLAPFELMYNKFAEAETLLKLYLNYGRENRFLQIKIQWAIIAIQEIQYGTKKETF